MPSNAAAAASSSGFGATNDPWASSPRGGAAAAPPPAFDPWGGQVQPDPWNSTATKHQPSSVADPWGTTASSTFNQRKSGCLKLAVAVAVRSHSCQKLKTI